MSKVRTSYKILLIFLLTIFFSNFTIASGLYFPIGESGTFESFNGEWTKINYSFTYQDPILIGTRNTVNNRNGLVFETQNITNTSALIRLCPLNGGNDGCFEDNTTETGSYLVVDKALVDEVEGVEAGRFNASGSFQNNPNTIQYSSTKSTTPLVFGAIQNVNGPSPVNFRVSSTSQSSFTGGICKLDNSNTNACDSSANETAGWIAIYNPNFITQLEFGTVSTASQNWEQITYDTFSNTPALLAEMQTDDGGEETTVSETRLVTTSNAEVRFCEVETGDSCDSHADEISAWLAVEQGLIGSQTTNVGFDENTPENGEIIKEDSLTITTNFSAFSPDTCRFEINNEDTLFSTPISQGNNVYSCQAEVNFQEEQNNLTFFVNDTFGFDIQLNRTFFVDSQTPNMTYQNPTPNDGEGKDSNFQLNVTIDDYSLANISYFFDNTLQTYGNSKRLERPSKFYENLHINLQTKQDQVLDSSPNNFTLNLNEVEANNDFYNSSNFTTKNSTITINNTGLNLQNGFTLSLWINKKNDGGLFSIGEEINVTTQSLSVGDTIVGETGQFTGVSGEWTTLNFSSAYGNPVLFGTRNTVNTDGGKVIEFTNITSTQAKARLCRDPPSGGNTCFNDGVEESASYFIFDSTFANDFEWLEIIQTQLSQGFRSGGEVPVGLTESYASNPLIFGNVQSVNGNSPIQAVTTDITTTSFTASICNLDSGDSCASNHPQEDVAYLVVNQDEMPTNFFSGFATTTNADFESVSFPSAYNKTPAVLAKPTTKNGNQDIVIGEVDGVSTTGANIRFCELNQQISCDGHTGETTSWMSFPATTFDSALQYETSSSWQHVYVDYNTTHLKLYLDDELEIQKEVSVNLTLNDSIIIGKGYEGLIRDLYFWNSSKDFSDVQQVSKTTNIRKNKIESFTENNQKSIQHNNDSWIFTVNQSGLIVGEIYEFYTQATDSVGYTTTLPTRTVKGNVAPYPTIYNTTPSRTDLNALDPNVTVDVLFEVNDTIGNYNNSYLEWKNSSQNWSTLPSNQIIQANQINMTGNLSLETASFELPTYEDNVSVRIKSVDLENDSRTTSPIILESFWDCSWNVRPNVFEEVLGFFEDKPIGNFNITNTGDLEFGNDGCVLDFTLNYRDFSSTYSSLAGDSNNWFSNQRFYNFNSNVQLQSQETQQIQVNASFPTVESPILETPKIRIDSNQNDTVNQKNTETVNTTIIIAPPKPLLFQEVRDVPNTQEIRPNSFEIITSVRNLAGDGSLNNTAFNVTTNINASISNLLSTNTKYVYDNLTNNSRMLQKHTFNITTNNINPLKPGRYNVSFETFGLNNNSNSTDLIINSNNQTILKDVVEIILVCPDISQIQDDLTSSTACTPSSPQNNAGGGGGGGSGGGGPREEVSFEIQNMQESIEIISGEDAGFAFNISNPLPNMLQNISLIAKGDLARFTQYPKTLPNLQPQESRHVNVSIEAPSYFTRGTHTISFTVNGITKENITLGQTNTTRTTEFENNVNITLEVYLIRYQEANQTRIQAQDAIDNLQLANINTKRLESLLTEATNLLQDGLRTEAKSSFENIQSLSKIGFALKQELPVLQEKIRVGLTRDIPLRESQRILGTAISSFNRGDFELAQNRLEEANLIYQVETSQHFSLKWFIVDNWKELLIGFLTLFTFVIITIATIRYVLIKKRIRNIKEEKQVITGLKKNLQKECFVDGTLSMDEYKEAINNYDDKLASLTNKLIDYEQKRNDFFKIDRSSSLQEQKQKIKDLIKTVQKKYLVDKTIESQVYKMRMDTYLEKLNEVEKDMAISKSKKEIKRKNKELLRNKLFFKGGKKK